MAKTQTDSTSATSPGTDLDTVEQRYRAWLARQPLATRTRATYQRRVGEYLTWLSTQAGHHEALTDPTARDFAVRDFKTHLKLQRKAAPASVNLALASVDHFYRFVGLGPANVRRERLPQTAPKSLSIQEQKQLLRALELRQSKRDSAIGHLLLYTGLRIGELHALTVDDVPVSARKGHVIVRSGKGDTYREIPFNPDTRNTITAWLRQRDGLPDAGNRAELFLTRQGRPLSERAIDRVVRNVGTAAGLDLSAHILRHSFCTNLVRNHTDLVLVAELAGHARLETIRRYSLPTDTDRQEAINAITIEY